MPNGGNKQWWWRVQRIHLARNGIVWNWCPNLINQFLENHRCSKKQRNLCLQLVHHCFHDVCIGYCIYRLLAHLAIRIGGNNNPRILHASGCWNVVYALLFRADVLLSSTTIKQTYLFLQLGNSSTLDTDLVLHRYRNTSLYLQCHSVVVTNSRYCRKYGNGDAGYSRNNKLFNDFQRLMAQIIQQLPPSFLPHRYHLLFHGILTRNR